MPSFHASVNQIGFDSYDWIASTIARSRSSVLMWVIGAEPGSRGRTVVDPSSAFGFPLAGRYRGGALVLDSANTSLQFSFGSVPLSRFQLRGTLAPDLRFSPDANAYAETICKDVPTYGPELEYVGLCNPSGVLPASGTFLSSAYTGPAALRPSGVRAGAVKLVRPTASATGSAVVALRGPRLLPASRHVAAILLVGASDGTPVSLSYRADTRVTVNSGGRIDRVRLTIPAGTVLPARLRAYVIVDAFPISSLML
jgi:hypothetical protein